MVGGAVAQRGEGLGPVVDAPRPAQDVGGIERPGPHGLGDAHQVVLAVAEDLHGVELDGDVRSSAAPRASTTRPGRPRPRPGRGRRAWNASRRRRDRRGGRGRSRVPTTRWRRSPRRRPPQSFAEARCRRGTVPEHNTSESRPRVTASPRGRCRPARL